MHHHLNGRLQILAVSAIRSTALALIIDIANRRPLIRIDRNRT